MAITNKEAAEEIQKAIDLIRQDGKDWLDERDIPILEMAINALTVQPEPCGDVVSRNAIVQKLNEMDRYVSTELRLCDTDKKFPQNEVFIVDDVYEEIVEQLPPAQPNVHPDGTLIINVPDLDTVHRVLVSSGKRCKVFYLDEE